MAKMRKHLILSVMFWLLLEPAAAGYAASLANQRPVKQAALPWQVPQFPQGGTAVSPAKSEALPDCTSHDHRENAGVIKIRKLPNGSLTWIAERDDPLANPGFWLWEVLIHQPGKRLPRLHSTNWKSPIKWDRAHGSINRVDLLPGAIVDIYVMQEPWDVFKGYADGHLECEYR